MTLQSAECGLKAAETTNLWRGGATMLAFGVGTLPMMLGVGVSTAWVSADRRGQLFRFGGWITLLIGLLTLFRNSDMVDFTGHGALVCLLHPSHLHCQTAYLSVGVSARYAGGQPD